MLGWNSKVNCPNWWHPHVPLTGGMFTEAQFFSFLERYSYKCHGWQAQNTESLTLDEERKEGWFLVTCPGFPSVTPLNFLSLWAPTGPGSDLPDLGRPLGWAAFSLFFLLATSRWSPARAWPQEGIFWHNASIFLLSPTQDIESHANKASFLPEHTYLS